MIILVKKDVLQMEHLTGAINVQIDARDKKQAPYIFKNLGINIGTFINITIKQVIECDDFPF